MCDAISVYIVQETTVKYNVRLRDNVRNSSTVQSSMVFWDGVGVL